MSHNGIKYTYNEIQKIIEDKGFLLLDLNYINNRNKITIKDEYGFYYYIILDNFIKFNPLKFHKSNPYTINNIKLWCNINNKLFILIDNQLYDGNDKKMKWQCLKNNCGKIFEVSLNRVLRGYECNMCNSLAFTNPELAAEWHPTKNGNLTPYDVTYGSNKEIWWNCNKNSQHIWKASIKSRLRGGACPYCNNLLNTNPTLVDDWNYKKNKNRPEDYTPNSHKKAYWICKECGYEWVATIASRNQGNGCPKCNNSKGEKEILNYLVKQNIRLEPQKMYKDLLGVGNKCLSYDFYLPDYNTLIEYQGQYHDGTANNQTRKQFEKQQEHDKRKREYAKNNIINLLEIWYWDFNNIEEILNNFYSSLG